MKKNKQLITYIQEYKIIFVPIVPQPYACDKLGTN